MSITWPGFFYLEQEVSGRVMCPAYYLENSDIKDPKLQGKLGKKRHVMLSLGLRTPKSLEDLESQLKNIKDQSFYSVYKFISKKNRI